MEIRRRDGDLIDITDVMRFCRRVWAPASRWHLGDLGWEFGLHPDGAPTWRTSVWERDGEIVAWGWLALPDQLALIVDPDGGVPVEDVLAWAGEVAGRPVTAVVLDTEAWLVEPLERNGYRRDDSGTFFRAYHRDLAELPPVPALPDGFVIRTVDGDGIPARAEIHRDVWRTSTLSDEVYRRMASSWPYRPEFDQVAVAPDGRVAAYVLGWLDDRHGSGEFEPVGTRAEFRRLGLSRALGISVMHAFRDAGATTAIVYARGDDGYPIPRQVYASMEFAPRGRTVRYHPGG